MALIFHSGWETGDFGEWDSVQGSPTVVEADGWGAPKTGDYAMRVNPSGNFVYIQKYLSAPKRYTFYIYIANAPLIDTTILRLIASGSPKIFIILRTDRKIKLTSLGVDKGSTTALLENTWYRISYSQDSSDNGKIWINGIEEISAGGMDPSVITELLFGFHTSGTGDLYFDDFVADDTSSLEDLGDIRVLRSSPNAVGTYSQFDTPTPSATHYENVDNAPLDANVDTDYNKIAATGTFKDSYGIENSSTIGLGGSDTIRAISILARLRRDGGGGTDHMFLVRDNGADFLSADLPLDTSFSWYSQLYVVLPNGGGAWTQGRFDDLEVGVYRSTAQDMYVSNMFVMVAFIPVADENVVVTPPTLSLTLTEYAPILKEVITPGKLGLTLTKYIPSIIIGTVVVPATLSLTITKYAPILKEVTTPTTLNLALTGYAPTVTVSGVGVPAHFMYYQRMRRA